MNKILLTLAICFSLLVNAQTGKYRSEKEKVNDLVHTKLNVKFDIPKSQLIGEAWITLTPHFLPTAKVTLDAKGMIIHSVTLNGQKRPYNYFENKELIVDLDRPYNKDEQFTIYISYTARPELGLGREDVNQKGLFFIDPTDEDPTKPTQIWTEGETENNSNWFPTIDSPNQKTSQELLITVPKSFETLSNGILISQEENNDGTRTDYWKQDLKHAPYLFFMGVGEFSVVSDSWKGKSIDYYVEKEYEPLAREIFGKTPKMLQFYEDLLGVPYPWDKYSQIVVRDYVSGAMENTTAVIHSDAAYQKAGELIDENKQENVIAHEVIHHWFGDLVTAESWSNLAMNEAFANYGEYLWFEYEYGKDYADAHLLKEKENYINGNNYHKDLIRFQYSSADDMFDQVSYEKGGLILHMLRNYLGDKVFFTGLKKYLIDNQFGTSEGHQLRLALESVSGKDLNWFFNQWFYSNAHPKIQVSHTVGEFEDIVTVHINQAENVFEFPLIIDIYESDGRKASHEVWVDGKERSFTFAISSKPNLVLVEPTGTLLAEIFHTKSLEEAIYQYKYAQSYKDRKQAIEIIAQNQSNKQAFDALTSALNDNSHKLRILALEKLDLVNKYSKADAISIVEKLAQNDPYTLVRAAANITLAKLMDPKYINHFVNSMNSKSYKVIESAVIGLYQLDKENTMLKVDTLSEDVKDNLSSILTGYYLETKKDKNMPYVSKHLIHGLFFIQDAKIANQYMDAFEWVSKSDSEESIANLVKSLSDAGLKYKKYGADMAGINFLRKMLEFQDIANHSNKEDIEMIIRKGMASLLK
ncbi:M1 family metallopeptidase [Urechidicola croceus]|nr:M1 family aminopeptidase [Urechidicola croceus]